MKLALALAALIGSTGAVMAEPTVTAPAQPTAQTQTVAAKPETTPVKKAFKIKKTKIAKKASHKKATKTAATPAPAASEKKAQ